MSTLQTLDIPITLRIKRVLSGLCVVLGIMGRGRSVLLGDFRISCPFHRLALIE